MTPPITLARLPRRLHTGATSTVPLSTLWAVHHRNFLTAATVLEAQHGLIETAGWAHRHADLFPVVARGCQVSTAVADAHTVTALERVGADMRNHGHVEDVLGYVRSSAAIVDLFSAAIAAQTPCMGGPVMIGLQIVAQDAESFDHLLQLSSADLTGAGR